MLNFAEAKKVRFRGRIEIRKIKNPQELVPIKNM